MFVERGFLPPVSDQIEKTLHIYTIALTTYSHPEKIFSHTSVLTSADSSIKDPPICPPLFRKSQQGFRISLDRCHGSPYLFPISLLKTVSNVCHHDWSTDSPPQSRNRSLPPPRARRHATDPVLQLRQRRRGRRFASPTKAGIF